MSLGLAKFTRGLSRLLSTAAGWRPDEGEQSTRRTRAEMMEAYYFNNGLYSELGRLLTDAGVNPESMKGMRNPTAAAVEFYADLTWPGQLPEALPIVTENKAIVDPIHQIWDWSNWSQKKQVAARELPMTGDLFLRVNDNHTEEDKADKVFITVVKSKQVTSFRVDPQGIIVFIRIDIGIIDGDETKVRTEIWDETGQSIWVHNKGSNATMKQLGKPNLQTPLSAMGLDFIPYVHAAFIDLGDAGGLPVIWVAIDKINEVNRKATRLAEMMYRYRKPLWALTRESTGSGQALPPLTMGNSDGLIEVADETYVSLPSGGKLEFLVPKIDHKEYAAQIVADLDEIKRDIPEMVWYEIAMENNLSGRALFYKMAPARARLLQMRGTIEAALEQADIMALKLGQSLDLFTIQGDDLSHSFQSRSVLPLSDGDKLDAVEKAVKAGMSLANALIEYGGMNQTKANEIAGESEDEKTAALALESEDRIVEAAAKDIQPTLDRVIRVLSEGAVGAIESTAIDTAAARAGENES